MSEFVIVLALILFTAFVGVFLIDAQMTKPSLERSHELFRRSIVVFFLGLTLSALWYLLGVNIEPNRSEYLGFFASALLESVLSLFVGLRHWRKFREYTRVNLEIVEGLSGTLPDE